MALSIHEPITTNVSSFLEALKTGSTTAILGLIIVFAVLAVIFVALVIMRKVLAKKPDAEPEAKKPESAPAPAIEEAPAAAETDDCAIVAAIVAAISAHTGKAPTSFRVVSFKRRH